MDVEAGFARTLRCPRCAAQFQTPRRWELTCRECSYTWQEVSVLTRREKIDNWLESIADKTVMPFFLLLAFAIVLVLTVAPILAVLIVMFAFNPVAAVVLILVVIALSILFALLLPRSPSDRYTSALWRAT